MEGRDGNIAREENAISVRDEFKAITSGCDGGRHGREEGSAMDRAMGVGAKVRG